MMTLSFITHHYLYYFIKYTIINNNFSTICGLYCMQMNTLEIKNIVYNYVLNTISLENCLVSVNLISLV